ncbi:MAG TPA: hypothetical protein VGL40_03945 [Bacillota bacterium]
MSDRGPTRRFSRLKDQDRMNVSSPPVPIFPCPCLATVQVIGVESGGGRRAVGC